MDKNERFNPFLKPALHKEFADYMNGEFAPPINVEVSLTGKCNAQCDWCFYKDSSSVDELDTGDVIYLIASLHEIGSKAITWTGGGEPTLHPDFKEITKFCSTRLNQGLITNALGEINYDPSLFDWIRVSKTNRDLNIENLVKLRSKCKVVGICINYKGDDEEVKVILEIAENLKLDYVQVRPALNPNGELTNIAMPNIKHKLLIVSDYKFKDANKAHKYMYCEGFHLVPFIWENGDVDVCGYMRGHKDYNLGNIYKSNILQIMMSSPDYVFVCNSCQVCCKNNELNKLISDLKQIKDVDFI